MARIVDNLWLLARNVAMIVLFPGTVTVYIPYRILEPIDRTLFGGWSISRSLALVLFLIGATILFKSILSFARIGRGTLAPFDETDRLIVVGLYRYVRNPMYVGVISMLLAEAWFFSSVPLLWYAGICFVVANLLVIGYEENRLRYKYSDQFRRHCEHVGRWIPGKPYDAGGAD